MPDMSEVPVKDGIPYLDRTVKAKWIAQKIPLQIMSIGERTGRFRGKDKDEFVYVVATMAKPDEQYQLTMSVTTNRAANVEAMRNTGFPITNAVLTKLPGETGAYIFEAAPTVAGKKKK